MYAVVTYGCWAVLHIWFVECLIRKVFPNQDLRQVHSKKAEKADALDVQEGP